MMLSFKSLNSLYSSFIFWCMQELMLHDAVTQYKDIDTNLTNFKMQVTNELTSNLDS